jgi:quercetin dioxygenase-like cupin family protein
MVVIMEPDDGVRLHRHPYKEIFLVLEGTATYRLGGDTIEASAGQIIVNEAGVPHAFINTGSGPLRQVDIHVCASFHTEWLE